MVDYSQYLFFMGLAFIFTVDILLKFIRKLYSLKTKELYVQSGGQKNKTKIVEQINLLSSRITQKAHLFMFSLSP